MTIREKIAAGEYECLTPYSKDTKQAYQKEHFVLMARFKEDLHREYGMDTHQKAPMLFEKAWSLGHSSGLSEVVSYYEELVDLAR